MKYSLQLFFTGFTCIFFNQVSFSQTFTKVSIGSISGIYEGKIAAMDLDNDLDYDLLVIGTLSTKVYKNSGGSFSEFFSHNLPNLLHPGIGMADFNNDGFVDLVLNGNTSGDGDNLLSSKVYLNNGSGSFSPSSETELLPLFFGTVDCADFDLDGDPDILMTGFNRSMVAKSIVYVNNGNGTFSELSTLIMPGVNGSGMWGDYDADGDPDILISGERNFGSNSNDATTKIFRNDGNATFNEISAGLIQLTGKSSWVDINEDGLLDILVSGQPSTSFNQKSDIYINNGNNAFESVSNLPFGNVYLKDFQWADIDNDGDKDLLCTDLNSNVLIYANQGSTFSVVPNTDFKNLQVVSAFDFDTDHDIDIVLAGYDYQASQPTVVAYKNGINNLNAAPTAPTALTAQLSSGTETKLTWTGSSDTETNSAGLTYFLRLGTTPGGVQIISPLSTTAGLLRTPYNGLATSAKAITLKNLPNGTYYASMQARDESFMASTFSSEVTFSVTGRPNVPLPPANITLINLNTNYIEVRWTDLSFNEDNFILERSVNDESGYIKIVTLNRNVTLYADKSVDYNIKYFYRIKAVNASGTSAYSAANQITSLSKGIFRKQEGLELPGNESNNSMAAGWIDFDNDNDLDIALIGSLNKNKIYRNEGDGTFSRMTSGAIASLVLQSRTGTWGDYDNDGDEDVFIPTSSLSYLIRNDGDGIFTDVTSAPFTENISHDSNGAAWGDYDNDGYLDLIAVNYQASPYLYHNNQNGTFTRIAGGEIANEKDASMPSWCDYNSDGLLDILLIGNFSASSLYKNIGDGSFKKVDAGALTSRTVQGAGASWADYDADGDFDVFIPNYVNQQDTFFENNGDETFSSVSNVLTSGPIGTDDSAWGDYDNDGYIDILKSGNTGKTLFRSNGTKNFLEVTGERSLEDAPYGAVAWGDYNNDGFIDLLGSQYYGENLLLKNNKNANHWIIIKLVGTTFNRSAIGAKVKIKTGSHWQFDFVQSQTGARSQNSLPLEFGLGSATKVDSLVVEWPLRGYQTFVNLDADQIKTITQPTLPAAPVILSVVYQSNQKVKLTWNDLSNNETGFMIERSASNRNHFENIASVSPNITSFEELQTSDGDSIFYRVYSTTNGGTSWFSNTQGVFIPLAKPDSLTAENVGYGIKVSWKDNSTSETGYEVERSRASTPSDFLYQGTLAAGITTYDDQQGEEATDYIYRIRAVKNSLYSSYSNTLTFSTKLKRPNELKIDWDAALVTLLWTDISSRESGYSIERSDGDNLHFKKISTTSANATSFHHPDISFEKMAFYRIKAINGNYESDYSNEVMAVVTPVEDNQRTISICPNPATDYVLLNGLSNDVEKISISNLAGQKLVTQSYNCCNELNMPLQHLPSGLYILTIEKNEGGFTFTRLIVKK